MSFDYDVAIIGSGPAGYACAVQSAKLNRKVLILEGSKDLLGGTWVNTGVLPSKALREAARTAHKFHSQFGDEKGRKPFERFKMADLLRYRQRILDTKHQKLKLDLVRHHVETARGWGSLKDPNTVEITDEAGKTRTITARYILLATGSRPTEPKGFEVDHVNVLDYGSILSISHIPKRLVVVGKSVNAFEYATTFAILGTRVSYLNESPELLPFLDGDIRGELMSALERQNLRVHDGADIRHIRKNPLRNCMEVGFTCAAEPDRLQILEVDQILYAGGYVPNTERLNLPAIHLHPTESGHIPVNHESRTAVESVFAAGDVVGAPSLASVSFIQGRLAACSMFDPSAFDRAGETHIPYGIFSTPEIGGIGLTEADGRRLGFYIETGVARFSSVTQADVSGADTGYLKLVFDRRSLKLLGVHILGEQAADLIHIGQAVMALDGDIRYFTRNILNYPTYSEAYQIAAFDGLGKL